MGVRWSDAFFGQRQLLPYLGQSVWNLTGVAFDLPNSQYRFSCKLLRLSIPASEVTAEMIRLQPSVSDDQFFAAREFRRVRFDWTVPRLTATGVNTAELLARRSFRAQLIQLDGGLLDTLSSRDKPKNPHPKKRLMPSEALAAIPYPIEVNRLSVTNGTIRMGQRPPPAKSQGS